MKKPVLVIMAAGMGSRYGGLKQIDPVDQEGHIIMDFSIFDAKRAGFEKVVFIIKKENEADFKEAVGKRIEKIMDVAYVFQDLNNLPEGYEVPEGRVKPSTSSTSSRSAMFPDVPLISPCSTASKIASNTCFLMFSYFIVCVLL